jgi:imidazolonepropionase-like amidohydrolase
MPESYVRAAVIRAHELKMKVAAHVEGQIGLSVALETGVDYIEHGSLITKTMIEDYKRNGTCNIATFSPYVAFSHVDPDLLDMTPDQIRASEIVLKGIVEATKGCLAHHIPVGLGSDPGYPFVTHYDMWRELYYFTQLCDVDNNFALHTATQVNAKILCIEYTRGTIEPGKFADMIVTKRNPLDDLSALKEISYIFTRGQKIDNPAIERNEEIDRSLDAVMKDISKYQI